MPLSTPDLTLCTAGLVLRSADEDLAGRATAFYQRSTALLARLGFEDEGLAREYLFIDGAWRDHRMFALRNAAFVGTPK